MGRRSGGTLLPEPPLRRQERLDSGYDRIDATNPCALRRMPLGCALPWRLTDAGALERACNALVLVQRLHILHNLPLLGPRAARGATFVPGHGPHACSERRIGLAELRRHLCRRAARPLVLRREPGVASPGEPAAPLAHRPCRVAECPTVFGGRGPRQTLPLLCGRCRSRPPRPAGPSLAFPSLEACFIMHAPPLSRVRVLAASLCREPRTEPAADGRAGR